MEAHTNLKKAIKIARWVKIWEPFQNFCTVCAHEKVSLYVLLVWMVPERLHMQNLYTTIFLRKVTPVTMLGLELDRSYLTYSTDLLGYLDTGKERCQTANIL